MRWAMPWYGLPGEALDRCLRGAPGEEFRDQARRLIRRPDALAHGSATWSTRLIVTTSPST
jgi:hypothetical protein